LEQQGYGTVALNSRKYFWREKSPEIFAGDFEQLANYYLKIWGKSELIILGYSFGADVASFLPNRVSPELRKKIKKIALISPSASTDFVIRLSDLVSETENINRKYKVSPQIEQTDMTVVCTFGQEEIKVLRNGLATKKNLTIISLPGDHRYQYNFSLLVKTILI
jgi:type IV secretory pathway VirJ component